MAERVRVIGLGNRDRGDDGVGRVVAAGLRDKVPPGVQVLERDGEVSGLLAALDGAEAVYLVDAAVSGAEVGRVRRLDVSEAPLPPLKSGTSTHALGLAEALELARALGQMPPRCVVYAVEGAVFDNGAPLSAPVTAAAEQVSERILSDLSQAMLTNVSQKSGR